MARYTKFSTYGRVGKVLGRFIVLGLIIFIVYYVTKYHAKEDLPREFNPPSDHQDPLTEPPTIHQHRPLLHFSPQMNWMNDPNGLVYYDGEWHLFFQHNPHETESKNIHWGHAVSTDLITWTELPIAIAPENNVAGIWSGSVVIDWKNITRQQKNTNVHTMVAIYTWQNQGHQEQHMAYSCDRGRTWTKYNSNPVLPFKASIYLSNEKHAKVKKHVFRDPKVIYHAATSSWIFVLSGGNHVQFYRSIDLIHWSLISRFGYEDGSHGGTWECPDLIEFPQTKTNKNVNVWVLVVSMQNSAPAGGSGIQYFIGTFDGSSFENLQASNTVNWLDYGPDLYAGITYNNVPQYDGRQIMISWMSNWQYARSLPTAPRWRGQMSIPRQLELHFNSYTNAYHLRQLPARELYSYSKRLFTYPRQTLTSKTRNVLSTVAARVFVLGAEFHEVTKTTVIRLRLRQSLDRTEYTQIKYTGANNVVELDRSHSGNVAFHPTFSTHYNMTLDAETIKTGVLKLQVIVDRCSVELFINDGKYTMTSLIFPNFESHQIELAVDGQVILNYLELMFVRG